MNNIILDEDSNKFLYYAQHTKKHIFLTGDAGTGKSTILKYFRDNNNFKKILLLSPTGTAALNIGGMTIHKFFGLNHEFSIKKIKPLDDIQKQLIINIDTIIIDEISMVRVDLLDMIDQILKRTLLSDEPFGGKQLIFIGDPYQLPPVVTDKDYEFLSTIYSGFYFFDSFVWKEIEKELIFVNLKKIHRQNNGIFSIILNKIRKNKVTQEDLDILNKQVKPYNLLSEKPIYITTTNKKVKEINTFSLKNLKGKSFFYDAIIEGDFGEDFFPTDKILELKKGSMVMFIKNHPLLNRSNGTIGIIEELYDDFIIVSVNKEDNKTGKIINEKHIVTKEDWIITNPIFNKETKEIEYKKIGTFSQFPLILSYAITIHKSQGKTFDSGYIDISGGVFAYGQTYVGLSRCKKLETMFLSSKITLKDIKVDDRIIDFMDKMEKK